MVCGAAGANFVLEFAQPVQSQSVDTLSVSVTAHGLQGLHNAAIVYISHSTCTDAVYSVRML